MGELIAIDRSLFRPGAQPRPALRPSIAIVVPTLNECDNIRPLLALLDRTLIGQRYEIVFVDDWSSDGTPELIAGIARERPDVRLIRRFGRRGLSSAVIEGMLATTTDVVAVIDADLQHDESILPRLYDLVASGEADVAIGSRYAEGGSTGDWCARRRRASRAATRLAEIALPVRVADPMSGFFVVRRATLEAAVPQLSGKGFKVLLDLLMSAPGPVRVREVPYTFRQRAAGTSKLGCGVMFDYARLVAGKAVKRLLPARLVSFGAVGLVGLGVHLCVLNAMLSLARLPFATAQGIAVMVAIASNFLLNNMLTFRDRTLRGARMLSGLGSFYLVCGLGALANVGIGSLVFADAQRWWVAGIAGAVVGSVWNFVAASAVTWRKA